MQPSEEFASLDSVSHTYSTKGGGKVRALSKINLQFARGSFTSIVGPSGCGKSTLLNILAGIIQPSEGRVNLHAYGLSSEPRPRFGYVFQTANLFAWRTVLGNVRLPLELRGINAPRASDLVRLAITRARLDGLENYYPSELSGGMRSRAALAQAIADSPDCILLDEPFAALDEGTMLEVAGELSGLHRQTGMTCIMVTHSLLQAILLGDRVVVMSNSPGTIAGIIDVDVPKPQHAENLSELIPDNLFNQVRTLLRTGQHTSAKGTNEPQ